MSGPVLNAQNLKRCFGGLTAVCDFTLQLQPNEIVGLIGPNGAGKTTVFNLLTGVYAPDVGRIEIDGVNTANMRPDQVTACGMARTFQNIRLFHQMTVFENVKVGFETRRKVGLLGSVLRAPSFRNDEARIEKEALELLATLGLSAQAHYVSRNLPYGQQRKLEIARALATGPKILLLDEPAAGMNESESASLRELLVTIQKRFNLSILLIEHDMPFVMGLVGRLLVLDHGIVIAQGTPAEVRRNPAVIEAYLGKEETPA